MATTRYLEIIAVQRPFTYGRDERNRTLFASHFDVQGVAPVAEFEEDIVRVLTTAGLATLGTNTFIGPDATLPTTGDGPFMTVINTGGRPTDITHSDNKYPRLSCQIITRAASYVAARNRANAICDALDGKRNFTVTS